MTSTSITVINVVTIVTNSIWVYQYLFRKINVRIYEIKIIVIGPTKNKYKLKVYVLIKCYRAEKYLVQLYRSELMQ